MKKLFVLSILVIINFLATTSCAEIPQTFTIIDTMPRETDVPGWAVKQQYRTRSSGKIRQFSPVYAEYDPAELAITEYVHISDQGKTVRVEIIRLRSPLDSFGFYSRERGLGGGYRFIDDNTYFSDRGFFARMGAYYVKITYENLDGGEDEIVRQFYGAVRGNLKNRAADEPLPDRLFLFSDSRSTRNIVYCRRRVDAIPGLGNAVVLRRQMAGGNHDLVYATLSTPFDAEQAFLNILRIGGNAYIITKIGTLQPAIRIVGPREYLFVAQYKQWIFGVLNADTMNEGSLIIAHLLAEIKTRFEQKSAGNGG